MVIDWTQVSIGCAALLVMYLLLRFAFGLMIKQLGDRMNRIESKVDDTHETATAIHRMLERELDLTPVEIPRKPAGGQYLITKKQIVGR